MWRHGSIHNWKRARNRVVVISCTPFPSPHRRRQRRQPKRGPCYASARAFITVPDLLNMYKVKSPGRWGRFGSRQGCNFLILTHVNEVKREILYAESDRAVISSKWTLPMIVTVTLTKPQPNYVIYLPLLHVGASICAGSYHMLTTSTIALGRTGSS